MEQAYMPNPDAIPTKRRSPVATTPKTPAKLSASMNHRLNAYALAAGAAGVAVLACSPPANAGVVCKNLSERILFTNTFPLNPGDQTAAPFNIAQSTLLSTTSAYGRFFWWNRGFFIPNSGGAKLLLGANNLPANLASGSVIGPGGQFGKGKSYGLMFTYGKGFLYDPQGHGTLVHHVGNFDLQKTNFVGFLFSKEGKVHYGWTRLQVTFQQKGRAKLSIIHVLGWGYETTPNTAIVTGVCTTDEASNSGRSFDGNGAGNASSSPMRAMEAGVASSVPRSATLGMLAGGSAGLAIWRKDPEDTPRS